ncbi:hypothetical protein ASC95_25960 [Pelomonas sp. Root1217]|uniref:hypothetical protein n=1 Tax=Pelomonas sp. Root1217 TaxID=1736430 RepID=UPI000708CB0C|nr:hypothetical protein [Pelomonas sp. Root1217]KQV46960.1 hypothetical protein ASC95_25960 [Pelomonas sp. Root1217]
MSNFFWESNRWFGGALCCRYLVVRFGKLRIPMLENGTAKASEWHWALGFFADGRSKVIGAWQDDCAETPGRIAMDLHERGIERIRAVLADDPVVDAMASLRPKAGRSSATALVESGAFGPRMQRAIRWTDAAGRHLQDRVGRVAKCQAPFADQVTAADFIAQAFQRADRDLLHDRWNRKRLAPFGQDAFVASLAGAAGSPCRSGS